MSNVIYKDVRFDNALDARWAAFFDQVNWPWIYKPKKIVGAGSRGRFTFALGKEWKIPCLVKPIDFLSREGQEAAIAPFSDDLARASRATTWDCFLLLGNSPFWENSEDIMTILGLQFGPSETGRTMDRRNVYFSEDTKRAGQLDFIIGGFPYRGAITGRSYNHYHKRISPYVSRVDVLTIWVTACEKVRGRPYSKQEIEAAAHTVGIPI